MSAKGCQASRLKGICGEPATYRILVANGIYRYFCRTCYQARIEARKRLRKK